MYVLRDIHIYYTYDLIGIHPPKLGSHILVISECPWSTCVVTIWDMQWHIHCHHWPPLHITSEQRLLCIYCLNLLVLDLYMLQVRFPYIYMYIVCVPYFKSVYMCIIIRIFVYVCMYGKMINYITFCHK